MSEGDPHLLLVQDLRNILTEAEDFQFHDYKNEDHPAPKMALVEALEKVLRNVKAGRYDN